MNMKLKFPIRLKRKRAKYYVSDMECVLGLQEKYDSLEADVRALLGYVVSFKKQGFPPVMLVPDNDLIEIIIKEINEGFTVVSKNEEYDESR